MTCHEAGFCHLCEKSLDDPCCYRAPTVYRASGNLTYEITHPGRRSYVPRINLCSGCRDRALGPRLAAKLKAAELEIEDAD